MRSEEKMPLISIIVPIYKVEAYLDKCISSIVQQSYHNLEILLVDDGSPDRCGEICDRWAVIDTRIRVIHKINGGLSDARNAGINQANGEYLCFVDSDDYIEKEMIEKLYEAIVKTSVSIAACNFVYEYEEKTEKIQKSDQIYQISDEAVVSCPVLLRIMNEGKYTFGEVVWNKLWEKSLFEDIRYPVGKIHEDEYVFHRLIYKSSFMACIPYVGYHYLQRKNSIMRSQKNLYDALEALIDRCHFFMTANEREAATESEKKMLGTIKNAKKGGQIKKRDPLLRECMLVVWKLYREHWISFQVLCKRIIRFYIL